MKRYILWSILCNILFILFEITYQNDTHIFSKHDESSFPSSEENSPNSNVRNLNRVNNTSFSDIYNIYNNSENNINFNNTNRRKPFRNASFIKLKKERQGISNTDITYENLNEETNNTLTKYNNDEKLIKEHSNNNIQSFIYKKDIVWENRSILDYMDIINDSDDKIFSIKTYLRELQACKEAILYITFYNLANKEIYEPVKSKIDNFYKFMEKNEDTCLAGTKNRFNFLIYSLENAAKFNYDKLQYENHLNEYKSIKDKFYRCIDDKNRDIKNKITEIKEAVEYVLRESITNDPKYQMERYQININLYITNLKEISPISNNATIKKADDLIKASERTVEAAKKELGEDNNIYSIQFVQDELRDIVKRYTFHFRQIDHGKKEMDKIVKEAAEKNLKKEEYAGKVMEYTNMFSYYKYSNGVINTLNSLFNKYEKTLNNLYNNLYIALENKIESILKFNNFEKKYKPIVAETDKLMKYASGILKTYHKRIIVTNGTQSIKIIRAQILYNNVMSSLEVHNKELEASLKAMKDAHNSINSEKSDLDNIKKSLSKKNIIDKTEGLLKSIEKIKNKENGLKEKYKIIDQKYSDVPNLRTKIIKCIVYIHNYNNAEKKVDKEIALRNGIRRDMINFLEFIEKHANYIKHIINTNNIITKTVADIDAINKHKLIDLSEYMSRKVEIHNKVKSELNKVFKDTLNKLNTELQRVLEYKATVNEYKDINEEKRILDDTKDKYNKINKIKTENITNIIEILETAMADLLLINDDVIGKCLYHLNTVLSNSSDEFDKFLLKLKHSMDEYEDEIDDMKIYKNIVVKVEHEYFYSLYDDDTYSLPIKDTKMQMLQYDDIMARVKDKVRHNIGLVSDYMKTIANKVKLQKDLENKLKNNTRTKKEQNVSFLQVTTPRYDDKSVKDYEEQFSKNNQLVIEMKNDILSFTVLIDTLKCLNTSIYGSNMNIKLIDEYQILKEELKTKLTTHRYIVDGDNVLDSETKNNYIQNIDTNLQKVDKLNRDADKWKQIKDEAQKLLDEYSNVKTDLHKQVNVDIKFVQEKKDKWKDVRAKIDNMYVDYIALNKSTDEMIEKQFNEILDKYNNIIQDKSKIINEKVNMYLKRSDEIIDKLKNVNPKLEVEKYENPEYKSNVESLKNKVVELDKKIKDNKIPIGKIMAASKEYSERGNVEKDGKNKSFSHKKTVLTDIANKLKKIEDDVNKPYGYESIIKVINDVELEYEQIFIDYIHEQTKIEHKLSKDLVNKLRLFSIKIEDPDIEGVILEDKSYNRDYSYYQAYYNKIINTYKEIKDLSTKSYELKHKSYYAGVSLDNINSNKQELESNLKKIIEHKKFLTDALEDLNKLKTYLDRDNVNDIPNKVKEDAQKAIEYIGNAKKESENSTVIINNIDETITKWKNLQKSGYEQLKDEEIDNYTKLLYKDKQNLIKEKGEIDLHVVNFTDYKDKALMHLNMAKNGKSSLDILIKNNIIKDKNKIDLTTIEKYLTEGTNIPNVAIGYEETIKKNKEAFTEKETEMKTLLSESFNLLKTIKYENIKKSAKMTIDKIEVLYSNIKEQIEASEKKLNKLKDIPKIEKKVDTLINQKSSIAYISAQMNFGRVDNNFTSLNNLKNQVDKILSHATISMNDMLAINKKDITYDWLNINNEIDVKLEKLRNEILNHKKNMEDEKRKLDKIDSDTEKIEKDLNKNKRNYEVAILEEIIKQANEKKRYIESTKDSISSLEKSIKSNIVNDNNYIQEYDREAKKNMENYRKVLNEKTEKFNSIYGSIDESVQNGLKEDENYEQIKSLREKAQTELLNLNQKAENIRKYLRHIKTEVGIILINFITNNIDKKLTTCSKQHSKFKDGYDFIKDISEKIKLIQDKNDSLKNLNNAEERYNELKHLTDCSNLHEIKNMFKDILTSAKNSEIKLLNDNRSDVTENLTLENLSQIHDNVQFNVEYEMKEELENQEKLEAESNIKQKIERAYFSSVQILKYLDEIKKKKRECETLTNECKEINEKIKKINEIKANIQKVEDQRNSIPEIIEKLQKKMNELDTIKCDTQKYEDILEENDKKRLMEEHNKYTAKKEEKENKNVINGLNSNFNDYMKDLKTLNMKLTISAEHPLSNINIDESNATLSGIIKNVDVIKSKLETHNSSLDDLLESGNACEKSLYDGLSNSLNIKASSDLYAIIEKEQNSKDSLQYMNENFNYVNSDINIFNKYEYKPNIETYAENNKSENETSMNNISSKVKEAEVLVEKIKNGIIKIEERTDIKSLQNSAHTLKENYNSMKQKIDDININFKKIHLSKIKDIDNSSKKYNKITEVFNQMIKAQKEQMLKIKDELNDIKQGIENKAEELAEVDKILTLESVQNFNKIYGEIMNSIQKVYLLEDKNNLENKKMKGYLDYISNVIGRTKNFSKNLNLYVEDKNILKINDKINKDLNNNLIESKESVQHTQNELEKLKKLINENQDLLYNNINTKKILGDIWKKINTIKSGFSKNLPNKQKLFDIQNDLSNIKKILSEIKQVSKTEEYYTEISEKVNEHIRKQKNDTYIEQITQLIGEIKKNNKETEIDLLKIESDYNNVKENINNMNVIFKNMKISTDDEVYKSAEKCMNESSTINKDLSNRITKLKDIKKFNEEKIKKLEEEKDKYEAELKRKKAEAEMEKARQEINDRLEQKLTNKIDDDLKKEKVKWDKNKEENLRQTLQTKLKEQLEKELTHGIKEELEKEKLRIIEDKEEELKIKLKDELKKRLEEKIEEKINTLLVELKNEWERREKEMQETIKYINTKLESEISNHVIEAINKEKKVSLLKDDEKTIRKALEDKLGKKLNDELIKRVDEEFTHEQKKIIKEKEEESRNILKGNLKKKVDEKLKNKLDELLKKITEEREQINDIIHSLKNEIPNIIRDKLNEKEEKVLKYIEEEPANKIEETLGNEQKEKLKNDSIDTLKEKIKSELNIKQKGYMSENKDEWKERVYEELKEHLESELTIQINEIITKKNEEAQKIKSIKKTLSVDIPNIIDDVLKEKKEQVIKDIDELKSKIENVFEKNERDKLKSKAEEMLKKKIEQQLTNIMEGYLNQNKNIWETKLFNDFKGTLEGELTKKIQEIIKNKDYELQKIGTIRNTLKEEVPKIINGEINTKKHDILQNIDEELKNKTDKLLHVEKESLRYKIEQLLENDVKNKLVRKIKDALNKEQNEYAQENNMTWEKKLETDYSVQLKDELKKKVEEIINKKDEEKQKVEKIKKELKEELATIIKEHLDNKNKEVLGLMDKDLENKEESLKEDEKEKLRGKVEIALENKEKEKLKNKIIEKFKPEEEGYTKENKEKWIKLLEDDLNVHLRKELIKQTDELISKKEEEKRKIKEIKNKLNDEIPETVKDELLVNKNQILNHIDEVIQNKANVTLNNSEKKQLQDSIKKILENNIETNFKNKIECELNKVKNGYVNEFKDEWKNKLDKELNKDLKDVLIKEIDEIIAKKQKEKDIIEEIKKILETEKTNIIKKKVKENKEKILKIAENNLRDSIETKLKNEIEQILKEKIDIELSKRENVYIKENMNKWESVLEKYFEEKIKNELKEQINDILMKYNQEKEIINKIRNELEIEKISIVKNKLDDQKRRETLLILEEKLRDKTEKKMRNNINRDLIKKEIENGMLHQLQKILLLKVKEKLDKEKHEYIKENYSKWKETLDAEFKKELKDHLEKKINELLIIKEDELKRIEKIREHLKGEIPKLVDIKLKNEKIENLRNKKEHLKNNLQTELEKLIEKQLNIEPEKIIDENRNRWENELVKEFNEQLEHVLEEKINDMLTKNQNELQEINKIREHLKKEMHKLIKNESEKEDIDKLNDRETYLRNNIENILIRKIEEDITKENHHIMNKNKEEWKSRLKSEFKEKLNVELKNHIDDLSEKRRKELKKIEEIEEKLKIEMPKIISEKIKVSYEDILRNKEESEEVVHTKVEKFRDEINKNLISQIGDELKKLIEHELRISSEVIMEGNMDNWKTKLDADIKKKLDEDMKKRIDNLKKKKEDELKTIKEIRDLLEEQIKVVMDKQLNVNYEKVLKDYEENEDILKSNVQKLNDLINSSLKENMEKDLETLIIEQLSIKQKDIVEEIKEEWNQKLKTEFNQKLHELLKRSMEELSLLKEKELKRIKEIQKELNESIPKRIEEELISRNDDMLKDRKGLENKLETDLTKELNKLIKVNNDIILVNKQVWEEKLQKKFKENLKYQINKKEKEIEKIKEIKEQLNKEIPKMIKSELENENYETLKNKEDSLKIKLELYLITNIDKLVNDKDNIIEENIKVWRKKLEEEFKPKLNKKFLEKENELQSIKEIKEQLNIRIPDMVETTLKEKSIDMLKDGQLEKILENDLINIIHSLVEEKNNIIHENKGEWKEKLEKEFKEKLNDRFKQKQNEIQRIKEIQDVLIEKIPHIIEKEFINETYVSFKAKESTLKNKLETDLITNISNLIHEKNNIIQENVSTWKENLEKQFMLILNNRFIEKEKELQKIKEITDELNELIPQMIETELKEKNADMLKDTNLKNTMEDTLIKKVDTLIGESNIIINENKEQWKKLLKEEFKPKLHSEFDKKEKELQSINEIKQKLNNDIQTIIEEELKDKDEETLRVKEQEHKYNIEASLKKTIDGLTNENNNIIDRNKKTWKTKLEEEYIDLLREKFRERLKQILMTLKEKREKEEEIKRQKAEEERKQQELKLKQEKELERKKIELAEREQHIKSKLESDMVKIIKDELTKEKDEIIKNKDIKLRHSLEQKWLKHLQNILSLKIDSLLNKNDEVIKDNETQLKTNILNSLKNQLYLNLNRELNEIIKEYEESQKKILHSKQRVNDSLEQKTDRLVDIKPTHHGDIYTNKPSDNETEMLITSKEKKDETESTQRSGTDNTNSSESTTGDNTHDRKFSRSKNLSVSVYTAGSIALCVFLFSSIVLLLIKTNNGDNKSNEINEAFEPNDDFLFKEKDEIIEITFNDNDSTI
ncbi:reticulocyte binding protein homologue 7 [Plasmodium reichenowi]|uniref:Reticulocyte binding protein homologue 7 n=3 Tax=Plasmodium reichenowi TaxID=5854 RepID=A0A060RXE9_PLARE|nr:reticulocyte binding protein homologue 7 [Plasmodium reichenowi]